MMKLLDDFNRASGNKPEAKWGKPQWFHVDDEELDRWQREFDEDRPAWTWFDWFIAGALILGLVLVLSCASTPTSPPTIPPAVFDPAVWCDGYAEWSDSWCQCVWDADSTYFEARR